MHKQIFIGGTGRSGTSICYKFLSTHTEIHAFIKELRFITDYHGLLNVVDALSTNFSTIQAREALWDFERLMKHDLTNKHRPPYIGLDFNAIFGKDNYLPKVDRFIESLTDSKWYGTDYQVKYDFFNCHLPKTWRITERIFSKMVRGYLKALNKERYPINLWPKRVLRDVKYFTDRNELTSLVGIFVDDLFASTAAMHGKTHWCEKTPNNLLHLEFLFEILPESYFIHMTRDPRGVAYSFVGQFWSNSNLEEVCYSLKKMYQRWFDLKNRVDFTRYHFLELKLEDCAKDNQWFVRNLCDFLNINNSFDNPPVLNLSSANHWMDTIQKREREIIESILQNEILELGYNI